MSPKSRKKKAASNLARWRHGITRKEMRRCVRAVERLRRFMRDWKGELEVVIEGTSSFITLRAQEESL